MYVCIGTSFCMNISTIACTDNFTLFNLAFYGEQKFSVSQKKTICIKIVGKISAWEKFDNKSVPKSISLTVIVVYFTQGCKIISRSPNQFLGNQFFVTIFSLFLNTITFHWVFSCLKSLGWPFLNNDT